MPKENLKQALEKGYKGSFMVCHRRNFYEGWMDQIWDFNELTAKDKDTRGFSFQIFLETFLGVVRTPANFCEVP